MTLLRRQLQPEARPPSLRFRSPNLHVPLWLLAIGWLAVTGWRGLRWLARHPRSTVVGLLVLALLWTDTVLPATVVLGLVASAAVIWWAVDAPTFRRRLLWPVQLRLREWLVYRRNWQPAMLTAGLSLRESWGGDLPVLRTVRCVDGRDVLRVRMLPGQTLQRWSDAAPALAQTWGVPTVRVRKVPDRPQELLLVVGRKSVSAVTERRADTEPVPRPAGRGAFPRQARGGGAA